MNIVYYYFLGNNVNIKQYCIRINKIMSIKTHVFYLINTISHDQSQHYCLSTHTPTLKFIF